MRRDRISTFAFRPEPGRNGRDVRASTWRGAGRPDFGQRSGWRLGPADQPVKQSAWPGFRGVERETQAKPARKKKKTRPVCVLPGSSGAPNGWTTTSRTNRQLRCPRRGALRDTVTSMPSQRYGLVPALTDRPAAVSGRKPGRPLPEKGRETSSPPGTGALVGCSLSLGERSQGFSAGYGVASAPWTGRH